MSILFPPVSSVGRMISEHRKKAGYSQQQLALELNSRFGHEVSNKSISKWETDAAEPSLSVFFDLCRVLHITDIYGSYFGTNPADPFSSLNDAGRERVLEYVSLLSADGRFAKPAPAKLPSKRTIPLQLYPVSAGPGNLLDDENYEAYPVGDDVPETADFAVRVSGDSMEPLLHRNQIIFIHRQDTLESGDIGIFFLDGEAYVKKFRSDSSGTALVSLNSRYQPIPVTEASDFRIFGKMVYRAE